MARLDLSFLGTFHATLDGRPLTHFRANNNKGLLVYLALNGERPIPRSAGRPLLAGRERRHRQ